MSIVLLVKRYIYTETDHMVMSAFFVALALVSILFLFHFRNDFTPMSTTRVLNHEHSCCARNHDIYFLELPVETAVCSISLPNASATSWPENTRMCIILCGYDNADLALPLYGCLIYTEIETWLIPSHLPHQPRLHVSSYVIIWDSCRKFPQSLAWRSQVSWWRH